jgi:hypothetical protein
MPLVRFEHTIPTSERAKTVLALRLLGFRDRPGITLPYYILFLAYWTLIAQIM